MLNEKEKLESGKPGYYNCLCKRGLQINLNGSLIIEITALIWETRRLKKEVNLYILTWKIDITCED